MMDMFSFGRRVALLKSLGSKRAQRPAGKPRDKGRVAPPPRSVDSDGRLRRLRQLVEDTRLL